MKYTIIKSKKQYLKYCNTLEYLGDISSPSKTIIEEIDLLQLLIDSYDQAQWKLKKVPAHVFLKSLMTERKMKNIDLAELLNVSPGLVCDMLQGKKAFSKNSIRKIAQHFNVSQEAFNFTPQETSV
jgi:HTH-type transcriptional regulator / antitoxin HigA